jgi:hypothetical protein
MGPALSAIVIAYVGLALANRLTFTVLDEAGFVCTASGNLDQLKDIPAEGVLFSFDVSNPCFATGYQVGRLERYHLWTTPKPAELNDQFQNYRVERGTCTAAPDEKLFNGSVAADARGYGIFRNAQEQSLGVKATIWNALLLPLKRHYTELWFQPVARYSAIGSEFEFLEPDPDPKVTIISEIVRPKVPGELFFYFNDAVTAIPRFQPFYGDNRGCATFFIKPR